MVAFMFSLQFSVKYVSLFVLLVCTNILGDYLLTISPVNDKIIAARAVGDNATHGAIAAISWLMVSVLNNTHFDKTTVLNCAISALLACSIDIDHFLAARSFHLKDVLNLKSRPSFHCTSAMLILIAFIVIYGIYFTNETAISLSCLLFVAVSTHHLRDALRRGLWLYPLSKPLLVDFTGYWCLLFVIPIFTHFVHEFCMKTVKEDILLNKIDNYNV